VAESLPDGTEELQREFVEMCLSLGHQLSAKGAAVLISGGRVLASVGIIGVPSGEGDRKYTFRAGERAAILIVATGKPSWEHTPGGVAQPALDLLAAQLWTGNVLDAYAARGTAQAAFVPILSTAQAKAYGLLP